MAERWLAIRVTLLAGRGDTLWPPPGRDFVVGPRHTFADLAKAIDDAFARWDRAHLSQFTLAADTRKGLRPSFGSVAPPGQGRELFERAVRCAQASIPGKVATGRFGADMKVALVNDGPVTFWLQIPTSGATE